MAAIRGRRGGRRHLRLPGREPIPDEMPFLRPPRSGRGGAETARPAGTKPRQAGRIRAHPRGGGGAGRGAVPDRGARPGDRTTASSRAVAARKARSDRDQESGMTEMTRAIDMWAPIVPTPEVMRHVGQHFPKEMAGYLRVFLKREPDVNEFAAAAGAM